MRNLTKRRIRSKRPCAKRGLRYGRIDRSCRPGAQAVTAANQIFLVMDAGSPKATFTTRPELQAYLRRRLNSLVYTFWGKHGPSIMTMSSALAE
jgi:hypothetical protein